MSQCTVSLWEANGSILAQHKERDCRNLRFFHLEALPISPVSLISGKL